MAAARLVPVAWLVMDARPGTKRVVHVLVYSRDPPLVLLLRRPESRVAGWQSVTGRVEPADADLLAACQREIAEETGLPPTKELIDLGFEREYRSPDGTDYAQRSFAAAYPTPMEPRLSDEHEEARWTSADEAMALVRWESDRAAIGWLRRHEPAFK